MPISRTEPLDVVDNTVKAFTLAGIRDARGWLFSSACTKEEVYAALRDPAFEGKIPLPRLVYEVKIGPKEEVSYMALLPDHGVEYPLDRYAAGELRCELVYKDRVAPFDPGAAFNRCTQLIKIAGCANCDFKQTRKCMQITGSPEDVIEDPAVKGEADTYAELEIKRAGGIACIPPAWTADAEFSARLRLPIEHNFSFKIVYDNKIRFSERAKNAAVTRAYVKNECGRCFFGVKTRKGNPAPGCSKMPTYCKQSYAPEEVQLKAILEDGDALVEKFLAESEYTRGQFWTVVNYSGEIGKLGRLEVMLTGWQRYQNREWFNLDVYRRNTRIERVAHGTVSYGELRQIFKTLPERTNATPTPADNTRAMWYASSAARIITSRSGWGTQNRPLYARRIHNGGVEFTCGSYYKVYPTTHKAFSLYQVHNWLDLNPPVESPELKP